MGKVFDEIVFRNGYSKNAPTMRVKWLGMTKSDTHYVIELGKVLELHRQKMSIYCDVVEDTRKKL